MQKFIFASTFRDCPNFNTAQLEACLEEHVLGCGLGVVEKGLALAGLIKMKGFASLLETPGFLGMRAHLHDLPAF